MVSKTKKVLRIRIYLLYLVAVLVGLLTAIVAIHQTRHVNENWRNHSVPLGR